MIFFSDPYIVEQAGYSNSGDNVSPTQIIQLLEILANCSKRHYREHCQGDRETVSSGLHGGGDQEGHLHQGDRHRVQGGEGWQAPHRDGEVQA